MSLCRTFVISGDGGAVVHGASPGLSHPCGNLGIPPGHRTVPDLREQGFSTIHTPY